ncbi:MAG: hypothetical protein LUQ13_03595 [Methanomicrobiales archaeon]|nr:hypothetical protein [Methanomicrobiales archaeon]
MPVKSIQLLKWLVIALIIVVIGSLVLFGGMLFAKAQGTITGTVSIGPLCPVEPCNLTPEEISAAYAARTILVFDQNRVLVSSASIGPDGHYTVMVPAGTYTIELKQNGIDRSPDVPALIEVSAGMITVLDIHIDTGIR